MSHEIDAEALRLMREVRALFISMNLPPGQRDAKVQVIFEELLTSRSLAPLQADAGEWARETFPNAYGYSIGSHIKDEAQEVRDVLVNFGFAGTPARLELWRANLAEECSDLLLLLLSTADRYGFDLLTEARRVFEQKKSRRYEYDPARGYARHVEEKGEGDEA